MMKPEHLNNVAALDFRCDTMENCVELLSSKEATIYRRAHKRANPR
jgi:hypothetical protein